MAGTNTGENNSQLCRNRGEGGELKPRARPSIGASRSCDVRGDCGELFKGNGSVLTCTKLCGILTGSCRSRREAGACPNRAAFLDTIQNSGGGCHEKLCYKKKCGR